MQRPEEDIKHLLWHSTLFFETWFLTESEADRFSWASWTELIDHCLHPLDTGLEARAVVSWFFETGFLCVVLAVLELPL